MDPKHIATLSLVGVLVVVHVLQELCAVDIIAKLQSAFNCCRNFRSSVREWWKQEVGMLDGEVQKRLLAWQLEQFRWTLQLSSNIFLCVAILMVLDVVNMDTEEYNVLETVFILLGYTLTLVPLCCSCLMGSRTMDLWYFAIMATVALQASPAPCGRWDCTSELLFARTLAVLLTAGRMSSRGAAFWSLVLLAVTAPRWWYDDTTIHHDVGFSVIVLLLTRFLERWTTSHIRRTVENDFLNQKQYAFRGLLKNFCDVVVELDDQLRIIGPSQDLAVFLLHGPRVSLTGKNFQDLLTTEKKNGVVERLQLNNNQRSIAEVVHAQMKGVDRTTLDVELFCLGFDGPTGETCYIVGVREYSDDLHGVPKAQPVPNKKKGKEMSLAQQAAQAVLDDDAPPPEQEVSVMVDTSDPELPIVKSSATFQLLIGSAQEGTSLRRLVCNGSAFSSWVQLVMNRHLAHVSASEEEASHSGVSQSQAGKTESSEEAPPHTFKVKFRPQAGVQTLAQCSVVFVGHEENSISDDVSEEDEALICKLLFSEVERKRCNRSRSSSSSSSSLGSGSSGGSLPSFAGAFDAKGKLAAVAEGATRVREAPTRGTKPQPAADDTGSLKSERTKRVPKLVHM